MSLPISGPSIVTCRVVLDRQKTYKQNSAPDAGDFI